MFRRNEPDYWLVLAGYDNTQIQTIPQQGTFGPLDSGRFVLFASRHDFYLTASKPVMVVQYLASKYAPNLAFDQCIFERGDYVGKSSSSSFLCHKDTECDQIMEPGDAGVGDPSMIVWPSVKQWAKSYVFYVPAGYDAGSYITVVAKSGTGLILDGEVLDKSACKPIEETGFCAARFSVDPACTKSTEASRSDLLSMDSQSIPLTATPQA